MKKPDAESHYEVLGVPKSASPDEIKDVFRTKAREKHPDKATGDHEAMARLNRAYDVLGDPKRRLLYDTTGEDNEAETQELVTALLMETFADGLSKDVPNVLEHVKGILANSKLNLGHAKLQASQKLGKFQARRDKIKTKDDAVNLYNLVIDREIIRLEQQVANAESDFATVEEAMRQLDQYESFEDGAGMVRIGIRPQW